LTVVGPVTVACHPMGESFRIATTPTFERDFKKLDVTVARRVTQKILRLAASPELGQTLRNMPKDLTGLRKFRVGDFRVLYWIDHEHRSVKLYAVGHRSSIYERL
jgi:addiction module RelE/StbE family toxin